MLSLVSERYGSSSSTGRHGFCIADVTITIAIIAILAAILFPVFARSREKARAVSCVTNLANIALALRTYATDHDMRYPPTDNDLAPLWPVYFNNATAFKCPSAASGMPMGSIPAPPEPPTRPPGPPEPGMPPPAPQFSQPPHVPEGMQTGYFYLSGHRYDRMVAAVPLAGDAMAWHNDRRNVLLTDGAIKSWTAANYYAADLHRYTMMGDGQ
jgi:type II secretory pathway pseudopilin PulG